MPLRGDAVVISLVRLASHWLCLAVADYVSRDCLSVEIFDALHQIFLSFDALAPRTGAAPAHQRLSRHDA